jgi:hypothetical protein
MGRGNVYVTGSYEGLFYIDNDDLQVWRKDGPDGKEPEIRMMADISLDELVADDWYVDEIESSYKEEDVLRCFCAELRKLCPSFQPAANSNVWLGNERRVILENELFYICVEDNEWSLAVELIQKDGYSDCQSAWLAGLQKRRYRGYLDDMKKALLARLPSIGVRTGPTARRKRKQLTGSSKSSALTALPLMSSPMSAERRRTCEPLYSP